jgi:sulfhydrogenase subunit delta
MVTTVVSGPQRAQRPKLAVWKFASCDGCQLTLLDCEDELLALAEQVEIAHFLEASSATVEGPYDVSLVEGSITNAADVERIERIRAMSGTVVTIGACATSGGIQALRNLADVDRYLAVVYATPAYLATLVTSTPIAAHVPVDLELRGCPIDKHQLLDAVDALLRGRRPNVSGRSVCAECKLRGNVCVLVAGGDACLGPVTHAGCGALCPTYQRGCYGCFGPADDVNAPSLTEELRHRGIADGDIVRLLRTFNTAAPAFARESARIPGDEPVEAQT